jgi:hypothetical protein
LVEGLTILFLLLFTDEFNFQEGLLGRVEPPLKVAFQKQACDEMCQFFNEALARCNFEG